MGKTPKYLNFQERQVIEDGLKNHLYCYEIATLLKRSRNSISRELRNYRIFYPDRSYNAIDAQIRAEQKRKRIESYPALVKRFDLLQMQIDILTEQLKDIKNENNK